MEMVYTIYIGSLIEAFCHFQMQFIEQYSVKKSSSYNLPLYTFCIFISQS